MSIAVVSGKMFVINLKIPRLTLISIRFPCALKASPYC